MPIKVAVLFVYSFLFSGCLSGCATTFIGDAHVSGGRAGCEKKCASQGFKCTGMVYMGEYSSACVCGEREAPSGGASVSAAAGSSVGVVMQMRAQQQQQQHAMH
jgi:hypothetical protein